MKRSKKRRREFKKKEESRNRSQWSCPEEETGDGDMDKEHGKRERPVVRPEEIPPVPENQFLLRSDMPAQEENPYITQQVASSVPIDFKPVGTKSGRKIKGRGTMRYHTPPQSKSCSESEDRGSSETPPHWKEEMQKNKTYQPPCMEKWIKGDKLNDHYSSCWDNRSASPQSKSWSQEYSSDHTPRVYPLSEHEMSASSGRRSKLSSHLKRRVSPGSLFDKVHKKARLNQRPRNQKISSEDRSPSACDKDKSRSRSRSKSRSISTRRSRSRIRSHSSSHSRSRSGSSSSSYSEDRSPSACDKDKSRRGSRRKSHSISTRRSRSRTRSHSSSRSRSRSGSSSSSYRSASPRSRSWSQEYSSDHSSSQHHQHKKEKKKGKHKRKKSKKHKRHKTSKGKPRVSPLSEGEMSASSVRRSKLSIHLERRVSPGSLFDEVHKKARLNQRPRNQKISSKDRSPSACDKDKSRSRSRRKSHSISTRQSRSRTRSHSSSRSRSRSGSSSSSYSRSDSRSRSHRRYSRGRSHSSSYHSHSRTYSRSKSRSRSYDRHRRSRLYSYDSDTSRSRSRSRGRRRSESYRSSDGRSRSYRSYSASDRSHSRSSRYS